MIDWIIAGIIMLLAVLVSWIGGRWWHAAY